MANEAETDLPAGQPVPYDRFSEVNGRMKAAEAKVAELSPLAQRAQDGDAALARFSRYQESATRGIVDPSIFEAVEGHWSKLPEKDRPTVGAYIDQLRADPSHAPALLRPHLAAAAAPAAGATPLPQAAPAPVVPGARLPQPNTPAAALPPGAAATPSPEAIRQAREVGVRTGDWSSWKAMRTTLGVGR
jgi:hypothetical protein